MNRKALLQAGLTENKNVETLVASTLKQDKKILAKAVRDLDDSIEETEEALEERLTSNVALDKSVVEVTYKKLQDLKATKALYEAFTKEFLTESN